MDAMRRPFAVADLFRGLAAEIGGLRAQLLCLEPALSRAPEPYVRSQDLQQIDLILQSLDDVALLTWHLGHSASGELVIDAGPALAALRLERVRARFAPHDPALEAASTVTLFPCG